MLSYLVSLGQFENFMTTFQNEPEMDLPFLFIIVKWPCPFNYYAYAGISVLICLLMCIACVCELVIMFPWTFVCKHFCAYIVCHVFYNAHIIWVNLQRSQIIILCYIWVYECVCACVHVHVLLMCVPYSVIIVGYNSSICC